MDNEQLRALLEQLRAELQQASVPWAGVDFDDEIQSRGRLWRAKP
jgi:hypothetical protein